LTFSSKTLSILTHGHAKGHDIPLKTIHFDKPFNLSGSKIDICDEFLFSDNQIPVKVLSINEIF
jgi:hypothetical protein